MILLNHRLSEVIGTLGFEQTISLLERLMGNVQTAYADSSRIQLITDYLHAQCLQVYALREEDFFEGASLEYREGRMACYHLLRKYTQCSFDQVAACFGVTKRQVMYGCRKFEDYQSVAHLKPPALVPYTRLEADLIQFLTHLH